MMDDAARTHHARHLGKCPLHRDDVLERGARQQHVETAAGERQRRGVGAGKANAGVPRVAELRAHETGEPARLGARFRGLAQRQPEIRAHDTGFREVCHRQAVDAVAAANVEHGAAIQPSVSPLHGRDQTACPLELLVGGARVLFRRPLRPRRDRRAVAEDTLAKARHDAHGPPVGAHERCFRR